MKKITAIVLGLALLASCSPKRAQTSDVEEATPAAVLLAQLTALVDSGKIAFGHHDDTAYGFRWEYCADSSDVKNVTGDYPAILDWDLGMIEMQSEKNLDDVPFEFMSKEIRRHHALGGINSISWHLRNPATGGNSWDTSASPLAEIAQGGALADTMRVWVGRVADYIGNLRDSDGNRIPVIFRPWHEHTGEWFWWGTPHNDPQDLISLWKLTREVFDERGIDNVVWAYSPDKSNCATEEQYMAAYPGDEYIDILGADVYHFNGEEGIPVFNEWMSTMLTLATKLAKEHGKVAALTESGSEACTLNNWYTQVLYPAIKDYPIAYLCVWRNSNTKPNHYYTPYKGHPAEQDFVDFYNLEQTAFLNDLPK